ncbi:YwqG family protein [Dictyobacter aurantiacus]|uniref:DUF1963 domain-containing protein n=1 Tax=Dictyobacter aurantiacus TaxID=1936993 RepID=A0A401ZRR3_9CHLR|nr:YwqG family protein [Dictyobacter aurantiacus]GCE09555.1 hypothetical protein KDAU_68840 [Dictyobacter aurantiacus]
MSRLQQLLETGGLAQVSTEIMQVVLPSIRLKAYSMEEAQLEPGATKFGGAPNLSAANLWPECDGVPLPFVAQINLSEVTSCDPMRLLPIRGLLSFFFDIDAFFDSWPRRQSTWRVLYDSDAPTDLQRVAIPEMIARRRRYRSSAVTCSTEITLPDYSQYDSTSVERLGLSRPLTDEEEQAYYEVQAQLAGRAGTQRHIPLHRLLGHPDEVQWDMHCELEGPPNDWQLLFQMGSDDVPDTEWGDTGRIYYWIRTRDLAKRDFSKVKLILQST